MIVIPNLPPVGALTLKNPPTINPPVASKTSRYYLFADMLKKLIALEAVTRTSLVQHCPQPLTGPATWPPPGAADLPQVWKQEQWAVKIKHKELQIPEFAVSKYWASYFLWFTAGVGCLEEVLRCYVLDITTNVGVWDQVLTLVSPEELRMLVAFELEVCPPPEVLE